MLTPARARFRLGGGLFLVLSFFLQLLTCNGSTDDAAEADGNSSSNPLSMYPREIFGLPGNRANTGFVRLPPLRAAFACCLRIVLAGCPPPPPRARALCW